jgi:hypothetical protein
MRRRLRRNRYNVEQLGGFEGMSSVFINTLTCASSEYLIFGAARAFRYMIFFCERDRIGGCLLRGLSSVVLVLAYFVRISRMQRSVRLYARAASAHVQPAASIPIIWSLCTTVKFGPLRIF